MLEFRAVMAAVVILAAGAVVAPAPVAGADDTTVPAQYIARMYTDVLGRAPTPSEWNAWSAHFQGPGGCIDELRVMGEHLAGTKPQTSIDNGGSHLELYEAYPDPSGPTPLVLSEPVDYTGDSTIDAADAAFFDDVVRAARIMPLVRALFGHEINTHDWSNRVEPYLDGSRTWDDTVDALFDVLDPSNPITRAMIGTPICDVSDPTYGPSRDSAPLDLLQLIGDLRGHNSADPHATASRDQATLETAIAAGGLVLLKPGEVIGVGPAGTVSMPGGRTLRTAGSPGPQAFGLMGRLHASGPLCDLDRCSDLGLVTVWGGATLSHVWVDGQGGDWHQLGMANVETANSANWVRAKVLDNRLTNPMPGGAALRLRGYSTTGLGCEQARAERNLVTGYASRATLDAHGRPAYVDGIEVQCELGVVTGNTVVDVSGVAISVEGSMSRADEALGVAPRTQRSQVTDNTVVNAGLSARSALLVDPVGECAAYRAEGAPARPPVDCMDIPGMRDFAGTTIDGNTMWTSDQVRYDAAILLGSRGFWGDAGVGGAGPVTVTDNTTPVEVRTVVGIAVDGLSDVQLQGNVSSFQLVDDDAPTVLERCPKVAIGVSVDDSATLGTDVAATVFTDAPGQSQFSGCAYPDAPPDGLSSITTVGQGGPAGSLLPASCGNLPPDYLYFADSTCEPYIPFGYQYGYNDLPPVGDERWMAIARDLREIRLSGANTVRFSAELVRYIAQDHSTVTGEMEALEQLVDLAGRAGVYIDLTGLATYETHSDPEYSWFNEIAAEDYDDRWAYQQTFWQAVASEMASRTNIAFYDLMNEPRGLPTADKPWPDWCGGALGYGTWCWNQPILLEADHHPWYQDPSAVPPYRDWTDQMIDAIDTGAGSGSRPPVGLGTVFCVGDFTSAKLHDPIPGSPQVAGVDFMIVHNYPGRGLGAVDGQLTSVPKTMADSAATVEGCKAAGLALIVEETYTSNVTTGLLEERTSGSIADGMERWMVDSRTLNAGGGPAASGWLGNYLPDTPSVPAPLTEPVPPILFSRLTALPGSATTLVDYRGSEHLEAVRPGSANAPELTVIADGATIDNDKAVSLNASGAPGDTVLRRSAVDLGNDFSFEASFRSDQPGPHALWAEDSGGTGPAVRIAADGDVEVTDTQTSVTVARGTASLVDGNWHHVVVTRSGTAAEDTRIFVDGAETSYETRQTHSFASTGAHWWFGGRPDGTGSVTDDLHGDLDEIAVYDIPLSPESIAAHHLAASTEPPRNGATMQDSARSVAALWDGRHPVTADSHRDRYIADRLAWLIGEPAPEELVPGLYHPVDGALAGRYLRLDQVRFVQSNARYLGTSGPGA